MSFTYLSWACLPSIRHQGIPVHPHYYVSNYKFIEWWLTYSNIIATQNTNFVTRQAFAMSMLTILLQVWGKMLYLPILVPNHGGKISCQYGCGGGAGTHERTILIKKMCMCPLVWGSQKGQYLLLSQAWLKV